MEEKSYSAVSATQDERVLAALTHASVILPFWGLIGAIVVWATQREKSRFVGFQALQVIAYQLTLVVAGLLGAACYLCSFLGAFLVMPIGIFAAESTGETEIAGVLLSMIATFFPFCLIGILALIGLVFVLYGLYGAVRVLQGDDFRYAVIGRRVEQYLSREEPPA